MLALALHTPLVTECPEALQPSSLTAWIWGTHQNTHPEEVLPCNRKDRLGVESLTEQLESLDVCGEENDQFIPVFLSLSWF